MELNEALLNRRSIRKYTKEKLTEKEVDALLHSAMSGPSAVNRKPWKFYVISSEEVLEKLRKATPYSDMNAPLAIVVCGDLLKALPLKLAEYWVQDCSAASENILLRAVDLGLGAVWCGVYPQKENIRRIKKILSLPLHEIPLNILYIGHPCQEEEARDQYDEKCITRIK